MSEYVIEVRNLTFTYPGGATALRNVSFNVRKGEYLVIMGPNGAGKTTLCLFLNGVIPNVTGGTVEGSVRVMGKNTFEHHVYELALNVGMVLQDPEAQLFASDVRSEVAFAAENLGLRREEILQRIAWALRTVRLEGMEQRTPRQLSGGQKQRLAIAAALVMRPDILVLDEPTSQLDPIGTTEVFSVLQRLNQEMGMTVVLSSHNSEIIAEYADRIILLNNGEIVADGTPSEIFSNIDLLKKTFIKIPDVTLLEHKLLKRPDNHYYSVTLNQSIEKMSQLIECGKLKVNSKLVQAETQRKHISKTPHIEIRNLNYVYPGLTPFQALYDINMTVYREEFVALIGQNGSGKTTLLKNILGILKPTQGEIYIDGVNSKEASVAEWSKKIGLVLQNPDIQLFRMSAAEEVAFGLEKLGLPREVIEQRVEHALKATGLWEYKDVYPFKFSFGDRRKLAVAAVVAMEPQVLIFDEPTTGQDYKGRYELVEIARQLNEQGTTVIMVTHDMDLVAKYAERVFVMGQGRLLLEGPTSEVFNQSEILASTFLAPPQISLLAQNLSKYHVPSTVLTVDEMCTVFSETF